ncbi:sialic acid-binding Ig-like lectin 13 isoform X3 [Gopherus flavomarginatus]|uniref:sialic acid-binding Ig-like lectin 13 isoform X3 n=1 Tax=Gopherus flavomarginatus TaxID=286002 RepID=UPI0021CC2C7A|nr:sialic acid-binding Ig-like lectin 13 isoform X3 [Gopherus flavomarginatus]
MGRALPPQQDTREWELPAQGPLWRPGGPAPTAAMLRVLILALLWRGSLSQLSGFTLTVPQSVSVQEGFCVFVPCTFTYSASYNTYNFWDYKPDTRLYGYWYKDPANESQDPPVASSDPSRGVSQETQGRFRLVGELVHGDCSLLISEAQWRDTGRYFFRFEKGTLRYSYLFNSDGTDAKVAISVPDPPGPPNITWTLTRNGRRVPDVWGAEGDVVSLETQEGDSLSLSCEVGSRPKGTLSWAKGNESLSPGQEGAGRLELPNLSRGDAGEYRCWVKNSYGSASRALRVHVQTLEKTLQITVSRANRSDPQLFQDSSTLVANGSQLSARKGDSLRFLCSVASSPPAVLGWVRGSQIVEGASLEGENQLWLELPNVTVEDGGLYGCWAQNKQSSAQGTFQLLIECAEEPGRLLGLGVACGLGVAVSFFLLGLCVIKLWGREPALPRAEPGEMANGSQAKLMADDASLIYSNVTTIPMGHKTPAACRTKGVQDEAAAAQAPLGPGEPDELHYATINFSKLQRKLGESPEAPDTEYSEVRLK